MVRKKKRVRGERGGRGRCRETEDEEEREDDGGGEVVDGGVSCWLCLSLHCEKDLNFFEKVLIFVLSLLKRFDLFSCWCWWVLIVKEVIVGL